MRVSGTITGTTDMLDVGSNKTIIGVGHTATLSGFGLDVNGWGPAEVAVGGDICDPAERDTFTHVQNVIIRNLSFRNSADDSVNVQCYSHHVWVDHNTFYPSLRRFGGHQARLRPGDRLLQPLHRDGQVDAARAQRQQRRPGHRLSAGDLPPQLVRRFQHASPPGALRLRPRVRELRRRHRLLPRTRRRRSDHAESNYVARTKTITEDFGDTHLTWTSSNFYNTATITRANDSGKTMADWLRADEQRVAPDLQLLGRFRP